MHRKRWIYAFLGWRKDALDYWDLNRMNGLFAGEAHLHAQKSLPLEEIDLQVVDADQIDDLFAMSKRNCAQ